MIKHGPLVWFLAASLATSARAAPAPEARQPAGAQASGSLEGAARPASPPRGAALGSREEEARYAAREASSVGAKNYRAGDVIVISGTALVIILLVILIIVLI